MRVLLVIVILLQGVEAAVLYEGGGFALLLQDDGWFRMYPKEQSLKLIFAGEFVQKNDSLILTTHKHNGESAILAIYSIADSLICRNTYVQKDFRDMLPTPLYLSKEYHQNGSVQREYFWEDQAKRIFLVYAFSPDKRILSLSSFHSGLKDGKEFLFFNDAQNAIQVEYNYSFGQLSGKSYFFEKIQGNEFQVELVRIEKYKKGALVKTKTLEVPPVFYTSHF